MAGGGGGDSTQWLAHSARHNESVGGGSEVVVHKSLTFGCCGGWVAHLDR
jgi:hypothetical protein